MEEVSYREWDVKDHIAKIIIILSLIVLAVLYTLLSTVTAVVNILVYGSNML